MIEKSFVLRCDRCSRVIDTMDSDSYKKNPDSPRCVFSAIFGKRDINYYHLCDSCEKRVSSLLYAIGPTKKSRSVKGLDKKE